MTISKFIVLILACVAIFHRASGQAPDTIPEIERLKTPYQKNLGIIRASRDARVEPITRSYIAAVERLESEATAHADQLGAQAAKAEETRVAAKQEPTAEERKLMPAALAAARLRYEADLLRTAAPFDQQEQQMTRQYVNLLDAEQRRLVAENQVAKAAAVHAERESTVASLPAKTPAHDATPQSAASTVRAKGLLDPTLADKITAAISAHAYAQTENSGTDGDMSGGSDLPGDGAVLLGFELMEVPSDKGSTRVQALRPYFMSRKGVQAGEDRGKIVKVTDKVMAREGFAVAGLLTQAKGPHAMGSIQIVFMKIDPATGRFDTSATNTYKSKWYGTKQREAPKQIGGDGRLVVGVYGKNGADCDTLGLVELK